MAQRSILFVCTGNTCRSPMAEAIAAHLLAQSEADDASIRVASAGVMASDGAPVTPEALGALDELGVPPTTRSSRALTPAMLDEADQIYAMTRSHLAAIHGYGAGDRADLLDPDGADVPDPIGGPPELYLDTARALRDMIQRRLEASPTP